MASHVEANTWLPVMPEAAFDLVTEPSRLRRWLMVAGHIDVTVGGDVHLVVAPGAHAVGTVTEVEPGRRFGYTHGWVGDEGLPPGSSEVTVTLEPERNGTRVTVRHHGIPQTEQAGMQQGWRSFMGRLKALVSGRVNTRDWPAMLDVASAHSTLDAAFYALLHALRAVDPDDLSKSTPCPDFTIGDLVIHLVENGQMLGGVMSADVPDPDAVDRAGDPEGAVAAALWPCVAAAEALAPQHKIDIGGHAVTGEEVVRYLSVEFLVHAWDITRALDIDLDASAELCGAVLANAEATRSTPFFGEDTSGTAQFDAPVDPDPAATALDRLIALTGRQVRRT
ncbi:MAG: TIGR03086 family metal-binding protein [Ornithinimicrobium sp.]